MKKNVLIICPSPKGTAATQRLKYEQYLTLLEEQGYSFTISSFQSNRFWDIIYKPGRVPEKIFWTGIGYLRRIRDLLRAPFFDLVFVNLWVTPLGPPWFEWLMRKCSRRLVYDIDDMLHVGGKSSGFTGLIQRMKGKRKPIYLMKYADYVITCTPALEAQARELNQYGRAIDISSTFNTDRFVPVKGYEQTDIVRIGWTGTHSTLPFLESLQPVLADLATMRKIKLIVIANKPYTMKGVDTEFIPWTENSEVADLHKIQIGLYPIPATEWSLGKSSLKALTYMAIAIPFVATAYGTNFRIMENGVQGFLAANEEEWKQALLKLIDDMDLRKRMGQEGRKRVLERYSVQANITKYQEALDIALQKDEQISSIGKA
jgi:glycosyltransferase involved in cell wall biosynthesis